MAENIEIGKAFITIVPSLEGSQKQITTELTGVTNEAADKAGAESGSKFGDKFAAGIKGAGAAIGAAMAAATGAAVATTKAFIDSTNQVAAYGDQVAKESAKMHISAESYQELDFILQHYGSSIDVVKNAMKTLTTQAEAGSDAFAELGISQEELSNMSQEETFYRVVEALQGVEDESKRTVLAQNLLGKSSIDMTNLFNASSEDVEALRQQVHDLGGIMSDEAVKDAEAYQDAMLNMNTALDGVKKSMISNFLPGVTQVMDGLSKVFSGDNSGIGQIKTGLQSVITNIAEVAPQFFSLAETLVLSLIEGFGPMLPQLVSSVFSVIVQAIVTVTSMIPDMMPSLIAGIEGIMTALFDALPIIIQGVGYLIMELVTWISSGDNINTFVNGIVDLVVMICDQFSVLLPVLIPALVLIIEKLATAISEPDNVAMIVNAALSVVEAVVVALIKSLPEILKLLWNLTVNITEGTIVFLATILSRIGSWFSGLFSNMGSWLGNIKNTVTNWINNIKTAFTNWLTNLKNSFTNACLNIYNKINEIKGKAQTLVSNLISIIGELPSKVISIGRDLVSGLWNGISDKIQWVKDRIYSMGSQIINAIKGVFGIASPSKRFAEVGRFLAQGLAVGWEDEIGDVENDITGSMEGLTGSMTAEVRAYGAQGAMLGDSTTNYNGGNISINVYGAEGQNVNELAEVIAVKLENMTRRKGAIYA